MNTNNTLSQLTEIATRIKELREIIGYSSKVMAEKTDVDENQYLVYESGKVDIPFSFIHKCALALKVEMTELLEGSSAKLSSYTVTRKGQGQGTAKEDGIDIANLAPKFKDKPRATFSLGQVAMIIGSGFKLLITLALCPPIVGTTIALASSSLIPAITALATAAVMALS